MFLNAFNLIYRLFNTTHSIFKKDIGNIIKGALAIFSSEFKIVQFNKLSSANIYIILW